MTRWRLLGFILGGLGLFAITAAELWLGWALLTIVPKLALIGCGFAQAYCVVILIRLRWRLPRE